MSPAAIDDELPSPSSGLFLEVSFRRLLACCEDIVAGTSLARPDLVGCWQRSPVFHHYVETLQEQLADLEAAAGGRMPRASLAQYARHVEVLASQLLPPDMPAYCSSVGAQPASMLLQQQAQHAGTTPLVAAVVPRPAVVPPAAVVVRTPQMKPLGGTGADPRQAGDEQAAAAAAGGAGRREAERGAAPAGPPQAAGNRSSQPPAGANGRLQTQQQLHEDLTEELAGMAAQLKSNTQAIEGRLRERGQLLDSTEAALDTSVQRTKASKEQATKIHRKGRANFCLTCLVMLIVGLAFAAMYVYIQLTRFMGYRAAVPPPAAAPHAAAMPPAPPEGDGAAYIPSYEDHYEL